MTEYVIDAIQPFPKHWKDKYGPIRVMSEPIKGYLMVRRPRCSPFIPSVQQLLNAEKHSVHGPFELVKP